MAELHDLAVDHGATYTLAATWYTTRAKTAVRDLSAGWTARMQIRAADDVSPATPAAPLVSLTNGAGIVLAATAPNVTATIPADATILPGVDYAYDLELVSGSVVVRLLSGRVVVSPNVTR